MSFFKKIFTSSKFLVVGIVLAIIATGVLTTWGLSTNSKTSREISLAQQQYLAQLKASVDQLKSHSPQPALMTPSSPSSAPSPTSNNKATSPVITKTLIPAAPVTISAADKDTANYDLHAIQGYASAYWADYGYYPSEANYSTLGSVGASAGLFTPPTGIHFVYVALPGGCTTSNYQCQHFTLDALDSNNNPVVSQLTGLN
jgi:hypothetical protein